MDGVSSNPVGVAVWTRYLRRLWWSSCWGVFKFINVLQTYLGYSDWGLIAI